MGNLHRFRPGRALLATALLALVSSSLASSSASASAVRGRVAVLAVPGDAASVAAADAVRRALLDPTLNPALNQGQGPEAILDDVVVAARLRGPAGAVVEDSVAVAGVAAADDAFAKLDHERSVALLTTTIEALEADRDFSEGKRVVLEDARLKCAQRLLGLAGPGETGNGESKNGALAKRHLQNALKANPTLELGKQFPPKMKTLFDNARQDVDRLGLGGLVVRSSPPGATVYVDGRALGVTPLSLPAAVAPGSWRLWISSSSGDRKSTARVVDVEKGASLTVDLDLDFEGSLISRGAAGAPAIVPQTPWTTAMAQRLARLVDVDVVVLAGHVDGGADGDNWAVGVARDTGVVINGADVSVGLAVAPAAVFTAGVVAEAPSGAVVAEEGGLLPWLVAGGAVAGVVVIGAVVAGVVYATRTVNETATFNVTEVP